MIAQIGTTNTSVQVTAITTAGLIVVAIISIFTAKITSGARKDSKNNAEKASKSAEIVNDYAAALNAKDALIDSIQARLGFVEEHDKNCIMRLEDLERKLEENDEQQRASSLLERDCRREISDLRDELRRLKASKK